tara:strand:- start:702 stop:1034 length:333 start_codon:yes stop_codon:yes gene_type:complete
MAFTPYHNILGATARDNELVAIGDIIRKSIKAIQITNVDASASATVSLYLYKDSTDTTADETIYILHDVVMPYATSLLLDNPSILGFDNSNYGLHMDVGASDEIDVILST